MNGTAEVFRRAAAVMAARGQCKGTLWTERGEVCLYGALEVATSELLPGVEDAWEGIWVQADALHAEYAPDFEPENPRERAASWNDVNDRTQTEVEKFLLWAADRIDADEAGA